MHRGHQHAEAFCLMTYRCTCGHTEIFWNSRDGVTPFISVCPKCGGELTHVDWSSDQYAPDHVPEPDQGVWVDMPASLKRPLALARLEWGQAHGFAVPEEQKRRFLEAIMAEYRPGSPWLIRWPESREVPDEVDKD